MAHNNNSRGKSKRSYKWCGQAIVRLPETAVSTTKAEVVVLCPAVGPEDYSDVVLERTIINFSIRRATNAQLDGFAGVVAVQAVDSADDSRPVQIIDALSVLAPEYSAKNILRWRALPVPAVLLEADNTAVTSSEVLAVEWDIPVKRRMDRVREMLTLNINTDVSNVLSCFIQSRVLLSYGKR